MLIEKRPFRSLIVSAQASLISVIKEISRSGLSPMSHVHASIPAAIELGVKATNGSATSSCTSSDDSGMVINAEAVRKRRRLKSCIVILEVW